MISRENETIFGWTQSRDDKSVTLLRTDTTQNLYNFNHHNGPNELRICENKWSNASERPKLNAFLLSAYSVCVCVFARSPNETMQPFFVDFELIYAR